VAHGVPVQASVRRVTDWTWSGVDALEVSLFIEQPVVGGTHPACGVDLASSLEVVLHLFNRSKPYRPANAGGHAGCNDARLTEVELRNR
jgi:hypothetical protein